MVTMAAVAVALPSVIERRSGRPPITAALRRSASKAASTKTTTPLVPTEISRGRWFFLRRTPPRCSSPPPWDTPPTPRWVTRRRASISAWPTSIRPKWRELRRRRRCRPLRERWNSAVDVTTMTTTRGESAEDKEEYYSLESTALIL